jgi:hypothetical protein
MGTRGSFPGGKAAGAWPDHSPPFSAEIKNEWSYTSTSPIRLRGVMLSLKSTGTTLKIIALFQCELIKELNLAQQT